MTGQNHPAATTSSRREYLHVDGRIKHELAGIERAKIALHTEDDIDTRVGWLWEISDHHKAIGELVATNYRQGGHMDALTVRFSSASEALEAYRNGVISRSEARKLFGLPEDETDMQYAAKVEGEINRMVGGSSTP